MKQPPSDPRANYRPTEADLPGERIGPFALIARHRPGRLWECLVYRYRVSGDPLPEGPVVIGCVSAEAALSRGAERVRHRLYEASELIALARVADADLGETEWVDVDAIDRSHL